MSSKFIDTFLIDIPEKGNEGIYHAIRHLSEKAAIEMPKLYTSNGRHKLLEGAPAAACEVDGKPIVILSHKMLNEMFGGGIDFAKRETISPKLQAIIAHEMGHLKRGDCKLTGMGGIAKFTPYACAVGAVTALYLIRMHQEKNKHKEHTESLSPQAVKEAMKLPEDVKSPTLSMAGKAALYTVTAAVGLVAGKIAATAMHHHMEYACDAFSKKIMGSGEPLAMAFEDMKVWMDNHYKKELGDLPEESRESFMRVIRFVERLLHPSIENRIARLCS